MALYNVMLDKSKKRIYVLKCTGDPTTLSNWVAQDYITVGAEVKSMWAVLDGASIHIATHHGQAGNHDDDECKVEYHKFSTSSDSWELVRDCVSNKEERASDDVLACSIGVRSDGDVIVLYVGHSNNDEVYYARKESGVWTSDIKIKNATLDHCSAVVIPGANDDMHFLFRMSTLDQATRQVTLTSSNVLEDEYGIGVGDPLPSVFYHPYGYGISYESGAYTYIKVPFFHSDGTIKIWRYLSTSPNLDKSIDSASDYDAWDVNSNIVGCVVVDGTDTYIIYSGGGTDGVDQDIYSDKQVDAGSWGTDTEEQDGVTCNRISAGVYDRSGKKIGYVWLDGTTIKFSEKDIAGVQNNRAEVSWAELEVPNVPRKAQISWAELETPDVAHQAQVSWAEMEVPTAPRGVQISWAEIEVPDAPRKIEVSWCEFEVPVAPRRADVSWAEFEIPPPGRGAQVSWSELEVPTAPRKAQVSWTELEIPDAPRGAQVSWSELEVPEVAHQAQVSWSELEVPDAPRKAQISWAELEVPEVAHGGPSNSSLLGGDGGADSTA